MAFFTHQIRRGFSSSIIKNGVIKNVTIIGGGQMGAGIAQVSFIVMVDILETSPGLEWAAGWLDPWLCLAHLRVS